MINTEKFTMIIYLTIGGILENLNKFSLNHLFINFTNTNCFLVYLDLNLKVTKINCGLANLHIQIINTQFSLNL